MYYDGLDIETEKRNRFSWEFHEAVRRETREPTAKFPHHLSVLFDFSSFLPSYWSLCPNFILSTNESYPSEYVILIAIELHEVDCLILCKCYMQLLDSVEYIKLNDLYTLSHAWSIGWFGVQIWSLNPKLTGFRFE